MPEPLAAFVVAAWQWYAVAGLAFAAAFVTRGVGQIDPLAREASWTFRLLIVPGVVVWWPLLLVRWLAGSIAARRNHRPPPPRQRTPMIRPLRRAARLAPVLFWLLLPLLIVAVLAHEGRP